MDIRMILWLGKFAFPEIDTKRTQLQFIPSDEKLIIRGRPLFWGDGLYETEEIELGMYGYKSRKHRAVIFCAYCENLDTLFVQDGGLLVEETAERLVDKAFARYWAGMKKDAATAVAEIPPPADPLVE